MIRQVSYQRQRTSDASAQQMKQNGAVRGYPSVAAATQTSDYPQIPLVVALADLSVDAVAFFASARGKELVVALAEIARQHAPPLEGVERRLPAQGQRDLLFEHLARGCHRSRVAAIRDPVVDARHDGGHDEIRVAVCATGPVLDARVLGGRE